MLKNILCVAILLCSILTQSQTDNTAKLTDLFSNFESENKLMGTVSIFKNGTEIYHKNLGYSNFETKTPPNRNTKFRIGSITKTFTATIILQQIDEGKLTLNTLLNAFFPKLPNAHKITIEDLLRHQSGLVNITQDKTIKSWIEKPQTRAQMMARFIKNGIEFEPKAKTAYSNTNFAILSYISEVLDKKSFDKILKDRIIKPLNLRNTEFGKAIVPSNNEALPYFIENNTWKRIELQTHMTAPMGAGAIVSTPSDLNIFYTKLFQQKLTSTTALKNLTTVKNGIGLGVHQFLFKGLTVYGHDGGIDGFQSFALYIPQRKITMSFTFNGLTMLMMPLVISILDTYFDKDPSLQKTKNFAVKANDLKVYLGMYSGKSFPAKVAITQKGNTLFAQATGQPIFKLTATKKDYFIYDAMGIRFNFNVKDSVLELTFAGNKHLLKKEK